MAHNSPTLLTLPWDIRLQILEYLLRSSTPLSRVSRVVSITRLGTTASYYTNDVVHWRFETGAPLHLHPSVLRVCRQLHHEGYDILYANTLAVHVGLYSGFTPVDILGHWRFTDFEAPSSETWWPEICEFRNFEFRIFVDFTRNEPHEGTMDLWQLCEMFRASKIGLAGRVVLDVVDGSNGARFGSDEYPGKWSELLRGFGALRCVELSVRGDVPESIARWLEKLVRVDDS